MLRNLKFKFPFPKSGALSNQKGMTLIEILIVLGIIAGLATALMQGVFGNRDKAQVRETEIGMNKVVQALQLYNTDCGSFPSSLDGLIEQGSSDCQSWGPTPYLDKYPKDAWNTDLEYESNGTGFTLRSLGKDKKPGGSELAKDIEISM